MSFENSPSLKEFEQGIPAKLKDPAARKKKFRVALYILLGITFLLFGYSFVNTEAAALLAGKGAVSGIVFDENTQPYQGYIFILGTNLETQTNAQGHFLLENIPAGARTLIVANETMGREYPVNVVAGTTTDIGQIQFQETAMPEE